MQIFVRCGSNTQVLTVTETTTFESLEDSVREVFGLEHFRLYSGANRIESVDQMSESALLEVCSSVIGGGKVQKGKKKKQYSTPKKNKHRHKNSKLHVLSYYALTKDKLDRVKKMCA